MGIVSVHNPYLYRVLNRYKASGTNVKSHLYWVSHPVQMRVFVPGDIHPSTNVFSPYACFLLFSVFVSFLISSHLKIHLIPTQDSQNSSHHSTRFISSQHTNSQNSSHLSTRFISPPIQDSQNSSYLSTRFTSHKHNA
jgi:hypothetical protein